MPRLAYFFVQISFVSGDIFFYMAFFGEFQLRAEREEKREQKREEKREREGE